MTDQQYTLSAQTRDVFGRKTKRLRAQHLIPANIFGDTEQPVPVTIKEKELRKILAEAGETSVIYLTIDGESQSRPVLLDEVDTHPILKNTLHVAFRQVNLKEKVRAEVEIELIGELTVQEAVVVKMKDVIEVEALPTDLPESFQIDLSQFTEIGQELFVSDLVADRTKVEILEEADQLLIQVQKAEEMKEEEPEVAPVAEGAEGAEAALAGEASSSAEGDAKKAE